MTVKPFSIAPPETTRYITSYRLLFQLHTVPQQIQLDAIKSAADALTPSQIGNMTPGATDANGYPLDALRVIRLAYQQMQALGGRVDLLSQEMTVFFTVAGLLGLYGETSEEIAAEIARIQADVTGM